MFKVRGPELGDIKSLVMEVRKAVLTERFKKVLYVLLFHLQNLGMISLFVHPCVCSPCFNLLVGRNLHVSVGLLSDFAWFSLLFCFFRLVEFNLYLFNND